MTGTIMKNGVLQDMVPYGCHSTVAKIKFKNKEILHSRAQVRFAPHPSGDYLQMLIKGASWNDPMSKQCRYDNKASDERCKDCTHPYDSEYVESLK